MQQIRSLPSYTIFTLPSLNPNLNQKVYFQAPYPRSQEKGKTSDREVTRMPTKGKQPFLHTLDKVFLPPCWLAVKEMCEKCWKVSFTKTLLVISKPTFKKKIKILIGKTRRKYTNSQCHHSFNPQRNQWSSSEKSMSYSALTFQVLTQSMCLYKKCFSSSQCVSGAILGALDPPG